MKSKLDYAQYIQPDSDTKIVGDDIVVELYPNSVAITQRYFVQIPPNTVVISTQSDVLIVRAILDKIKGKL